MKNDPTADTQRLDPNQILIAEYNYIAQTAFQTNEDRVRYVSFYVLSVGSLLAAILSSQLNTSAGAGVNSGFSILFFTVAAVGLLTLLQLVRLRLAWFDSVQAMNRIKRFYRERTPSGVDIAGAFAWSDQTLPGRFKVRSVSFLTAIQVAILAGVNCGAAVMWMGFANAGWWWGTAVLVGILYAAGLLLLYGGILNAAGEF